MKCDIYLTDLTSGSEIILVKSDQVDMLSQQIDVPNYMQTSDQKMIDSHFRFFGKHQKDFYLHNQYKREGKTHLL